ncbi:MAG: dephospho-CoA kinase [Bacteroidia bacterium]|jgi:dephospho-CoA kinase|nr:dephospho-CoA kinase [Bacteroidia bacterium]MDG2041546.1 dephospho-CoA kinase [Bacteroidia bacterium]|tara:strand:+ start:3568 stop:4191 length:624 start_codon:yes stop_codon:yes gene_type:complete
MQHLRIGITGGIGAGKSTVCKIFNQIGIPIYDADFRAKWLMNNNPELKEAIRKSFGWDSYTRKDDLNRDYLGKVVFNNEEKLKNLNNIVHPAVIIDFELWTQEHKHEPYSLKEAALLFESNSYKNLHKVIVINSPIETRIERVVKRDHVKREDVLKRIENQSTDRERMEKADWIIYNDGIRSLIEQTMNIHNKILEIRDQETIPFKI